MLAPMGWRISGGSLAIHGSSRAGDILAVESAPWLPDGLPRLVPSVARCEEAAEVMPPVKERGPGILSDRFAGLPLVVCPGVAFAAACDPAILLAVCSDEAGTRPVPSSPLPCSSFLASLWCDLSFSGLANFEAASRAFVRRGLPCGRLRPGAVCRREGLSPPGPLLSLP